MKRAFVFLLIILSSCEVIHPKHFAINPYLIIDSRCGDYVTAYSPSTPEATTHTRLTVYFPYEGDTIWLRPLK